MSTLRNATAWPNSVASFSNSGAMNRQGAHHLRDEPPCHAASTTDFRTANPRRAVRAGSGEGEAEGRGVRVSHRREVHDAPLVVLQACCEVLWARHDLNHGLLLGIGPCVCRQGARRRGEHRAEKPPSDRRRPSPPHGSHPRSRPRYYPSSPSQRLPHAELCFCSRSGGRRHVSGALARRRALCELPTANLSIPGPALSVRRV